ncbi:MAG: SDR family NAD(P)-dependent oxidoreductase [Cellvibrionaceae bacterium]
MTIINESILITGATSGLGKQLALDLAENNLVIASGRNPEKLQALTKQNRNILTLPFDTANKGTLYTTQKQLESLTPRLDRVILNAGICEYLNIQDTNWHVVEKNCQTNYLGTINSLEICLPLLKKTAGSHIAVVSSLVTEAPFIRAEAYGASKAALEYFFNALRLDLKSYGIDISIVRPGFVDTPLTRKNDFPMPFLMSVEKASDTIIKQLEKRPFNIDFPVRLKYLLTLSKVFPKLWLNLNKGTAPKGINA